MYVSLPAASWRAPASFSPPWIQSGSCWVLSCGLDVVLSAVSGPTWLDCTPLPVPSPCALIPFLCPPHHHLLGQGGWGSLSSCCCSCWSLEGAPPTGHPANVGRGCSWRPALRPAERGPRQRKGRPGGGRTCFTTESLASPPLPAPPPGTLVRNMTFRTLWVETQPLPRLCSEAAPPSQVAWPSASLAGM